MSKNLKNTKARIAYVILSFWLEAKYMTGSKATHIPANSSITIDLWSFSNKSLETFSQIQIDKIIITIVKTNIFTKCEINIKAIHAKMLPNVPGANGIKPMPPRLAKMA